MGFVQIRNIRFSKALPIKRPDLEGNYGGKNSIAIKTKSGFCFLLS